MSRFPKTTGLLLLVLNFCFIWVSIKISYIFIALSRLDESKGYMLTEEEEFNLFLVISIPISLTQILFLLFLNKYFRKRSYKKSSIIVNLLAHLLLLLWFVFNVYKFTIIYS